MKVLVVKTVEQIVMGDEIVMVDDIAYAGRYEQVAPFLRMRVLAPPYATGDQRMSVSTEAGQSFLPLGGLLPVFTAATL